MPTVPLYNMQGEVVGEQELSEAVFAVRVPERLVHQVVIGYLANRRQGTAQTKTRGMVSGGGRKMWRQKGTGRARQGSNRAPHWKGGGTVFGPHPRDYRQRLPKALRRKALRGVLSARVAEGEFRVLDALTFDTPKTSAFAAMLGKLSLRDDRTLVVTGTTNREVYLSGRNIPGVAVMSAADLNAYDVLRARSLIMTADAVAVVEGVLGRDRS